MTPERGRDRKPAYTPKKSRNLGVKSKIRKKSYLVDLRLSKDLWTSPRFNVYLKPGRDSLIHFQVLLGAVHGTVILLLADLAVGEVPDAVAEAELAQLVVVGQKVAEGFDLFCVRGRCIRVHFE